MKFTAILLAMPLVLGTGAAFADSTTVTTLDKSNPAIGTSESKSTVKHDDTWSGKTVEKSSSVKHNADGSVATEDSKTVKKPD
jgi:hypothetical protein